MPFQILVFNLGGHAAILQNCLYGPFAALPFYFMSCLNGSATAASLPHSSAPAILADRGRWDTRLDLVHLESTSFDSTVPPAVAGLLPQPHR